jgi:hypothetical protein
VTTYNLNLGDGVSVFDANGNASVTYSPPSLEYWEVQSVGVHTDDPSDATVVPEARVTLDGVFKEGTYSGNLDASDTPYRIEKGQRLTCTWTGGTPGRTATFTLNGTRTLY